MSSSTSMNTFCDRVLFGPDSVEWPSMFSSFTFPILGFFGLFLSVAPTLWVKDMYNLFIIVGIGSAWLHATHNEFSGYMDVIPMIFAIYSGIMFTWRVFFQNLCAKECHRLWDKVDDLGLFTLRFLSVISIAGYLTKGSGVQLELVFGAPTVVHAIFTLILFFSLRNVHARIRESNNVLNGFDFSNSSRIINYVWIGQIIELCGAIFWMATEPRCKITGANPYWIPYLFAHSFWHVCLAYGFYLQISYITFIDLWINWEQDTSIPVEPREWGKRVINGSSSGKKPLLYRVDTGCGCWDKFMNGILTVIPVVTVSETN